VHPRAGELALRLSVLAEPEQRLIGPRAAGIFDHEPLVG